MALEKNKAHHIFCPADTSVEGWREILKNNLMDILIQEGWKQNEGEDFYSYPEDNFLKIKLNYDNSNFWFIVRSYSKEGAYTEQVSFYITPTPNYQQAGLFLNYISNSKGEIAIGLSSRGEYAFLDNFFFLIGLDKKNNAGVFLFPRQDGSAFCFMSLGRGISSNSQRAARYLDVITPFPHNTANTILYKCINYVSGETFDNIYGFYSAPYIVSSLCQSTFYINNMYYKGIGNLKYNDWGGFDTNGQPTSHQNYTLGSAPKCLKLV